MPGTVKLHRVLTARLQDQSDRGSRQGKKNGAADSHEPKGDLIVDGVADGDYVGDGETDLAAGEAGGDHDKVLQHEHGDKSDLMESRAAFAEKRRPNFRGWLDPGDRYRMPKLEDRK